MDNDRDMVYFLSDVNTCENRFVRLTFLFQQILRTWKIQEHKIEDMNDPHYRIFQLYR